MDEETRGAITDAVNEFTHSTEAQRTEWRKAKAERTRQWREQRAALSNTMQEGLRPRQARFAHLVSLGLSVGEAYIEAGYLDKAGHVPDARDATLKGSALMRNPKVKAYFDALRQTAFLANVLSLAEKRSFLADIVRTPIGDVDVGNKLSQGARYKEGELVEIKMPDKISALKLDAQLAGELVESKAQVAIGFQLINQRLDTIDLPPQLDD
jgi:phage terminase small subunit